MLRFLLTLNFKGWPRGLFNFHLALSINSVPGKKLAVNEEDDLLSSSTCTYITKARSRRLSLISYVQTE